MATRDILKNLTLWADAKGLAGKIRNINLPKLTQKTEQFQGGGMFGEATITLGLQALTTDFELIDYDPDVLAMFGFTEGSTNSLTVRGYLEDQAANVTPVIVNMRGKVTEQDPGTWTPGETSSLRSTMALNYYKLTHGGKVIHEIDVENMIAVINGTDVLAAARSALGL
ncbi:phage major tail tube protein [Paraburkholderia sp. BR10936]|uniref:phage major tail tube protein n=1 Tax=Paraburkholderia sp. BR10936 TaxID=3236993 RepID=UPI0034D2C166